jgi:thiol-disulfide isomerase/thioredoxin
VNDRPSSSPPTPGLLALLALCAATLLTACPATPAIPDPAASEATPTPTPTPTTVIAPTPSSTGPQITLAPADVDVIELVLAERARAQADGRELLVYVGASWCEPCRYFHDAVEDGSLDQVFPHLQLLEFDLDRDRDRLALAGYSSRMIPLFVAPAPDGRASPRRTEGGIKGPGAVDNLRPRVEALIRAARPDQI